MRGIQLINHDHPEYFGRREMDLGLDVAGHYRLLSGREHVRHDLLKLILQSRGAGREGIPAVIGRKRLPGFEGLLHLFIQRQIDEYRDAQAQDLPDEERVLSIRTLSVYSDRTNPRKVILTLAVNMADGVAIEIAHLFEV